MTNPSKKLGVIVGVDGSISQMGMYSMSNDSQFLWYGDILTGPKIGAFLTINQNDVFKCQIKLEILIAHQ